MPALFSSFVCQINNLGREQMEEAQISILCFDPVDWHPSRSHLFKGPTLTLTLTLCPFLALYFSSWAPGERLSPLILQRTL